MVDSAKMHHKTINKVIFDPMVDALDDIVLALLVNLGENGFGQCGGH